MKNAVLFLGVAMFVGGLVALFNGMVAMDAEACFIGDACTNHMNDIVFFPLGLGGVILGSITWMYGAGAVSSDKGGTRNPLAMLGFFGIFGLAFLSIGLVMLIADRQPGVDHTTNVLVLVGVIFSIVGLASLGFGLLLQRSGAADARILATGIRGRATVLAVRDTNVTVNNSPMIALDLRVEMPGQPVFRKTVRTVISRLDVGSYRPGMVLAVAADPAKPQDIAVDWDGSPIADVNAALDPVTGQPVAPGVVVAGGPRSAGSVTSGAFGPAGSAGEASSGFGASGVGMSGAGPTAAATAGGTDAADVAALLRAAADQIAAGQAVTHPDVASAVSSQQHWAASGRQLTPDELAAILRSAAAGASGRSQMSPTELATMLRSASDAAAQAADAAEAAARTGGSTSASTHA